MTRFADPSREHPSDVTTVDGRTVPLRPEPIGSGGEGTIYRTQNGRFAVKILGTDSPGAEDIDRRLRRLDWLPLEDVPICRPLTLLAPPHTGYVMEMLEDMVALRTVCGVPDRDPNEWYSEQGGLRRRLVLLARCAEILATLHERGIVYGDISPGNVLISEDNAFDQVWLVDCDNLRTETAVGDRRLGTRLYTAPELLRHTSGNTPASDLHSFATVAYETLTTNHPLLGDLVENGHYELEEDAQLGLVPWIDHSTDQSNRSTAGFTAAQVLTNTLKALFARTFEAGMTDPRERPRALEWAQALWSAADRTVRCTRCGETFPVAGQVCPWCGESRPSVMVVHVDEHYPRVGGHHAPPVPIPERTIVIQAGVETVVRSRTTYKHPTESNRGELTYTWDGGDSVQIRHIGQTAIRRVPPRGGSGQKFFPGAHMTDDRAAPWTLHFGSEHEHHRVLYTGAVGGSTGAR